MQGYIISRTGASKLVAKYPRAVYHVDVVLFSDTDLRVSISQLGTLKITPAICILTRRRLTSQDFLPIVTRQYSTSP